MAMAREQADQLVLLVASRLPDPTVEFERWVARAAARSAIWWTAGSCLVFILIAFVQKADPVIYGGLAAYPCFLVFFLLRRNGLKQRMDKRRAGEWTHLKAKWSLERYEDYIEAADNEPRSGFQSETAEEWQRASGSDAWNVVLGVAPDAAPDEIKAAYHTAMKSYHPDKVAGLGSKLQALAEEETKRLNEAYREAKAVRGA